MRDFGTKIDDDLTAAGRVVAAEYNSLMKEAKGLVSPFLALSDSVNDQAVKVMDIASKAMYYNDIGQVNAVRLTRGATSSHIETLFEGMVVFFSPAHANTSTVATLQINELAPKRVIGAFGGSSVIAGYLKANTIYIAIYSAHADNFYIEPLAPSTAHLIELLNAGTGLNAAYATNAGSAANATRSTRSTSATNATYAQRLGSSRETPDQIVSNRVAIINGTFSTSSNVTIPLPSGFTSAETKFFWVIRKASDLSIYVSTSRVVPVYGVNHYGAYIAIGVK